MSRRRVFDGAGRASACAAFLTGSLLFSHVAKGQSARRVVLPPAKTAAASPAVAAKPLSEENALPTPSALGSPTGQAAKTAFAAISSEVEAIFAKCKGAIVRIDAVDTFGPHAGTGFFIDPAGTIYTHYSVAGRSWNLTVEFAGKKYPATCLLADARSGVTLLSIQAGQTPFLPIGNSADLKIASAVVAIGYPMDLPISPTFGLVAGFDQKFLDQYLPTTHIRANVPVQPGEAGSPLLNDKGEVVGILGFQFDYGAVCLSLPIQAAEKVRADYLRFNGLHPGWIGVNAKSADGTEDGKVCVEKLAENSPAATCGIQDGDILRRVGRTPIRRLADLRDASFYITADEMVPIELTRAGRDMTVEVRAAAPPGASISLSPAPRTPVNEDSRLMLPIARDEHQLH